MTRFNCLLCGAPVASLLATPKDAPEVGRHEAGELDGAGVYLPPDFIRRRTPEVEPHSLANSVTSLLGMGPFRLRYAHLDCIHDPAGLDQDGMLEWLRHHLMRTIAGRAPTGAVFPGCGGVAMTRAFTVNSNALAVATPHGRYERETLKPGTALDCGHETGAWGIAWRRRSATERGNPPLPPLVCNECLSDWIAQFVGAGEAG